MKKIEEVAVMIKDDKGEKEGKTSPQQKEKSAKREKINCTLRRRSIRRSQRKEGKEKKRRS